MAVKVIKRTQKTPVVDKGTFKLVFKPARTDRDEEAANLVKADVGNMIKDLPVTFTSEEDVSKEGPLCR